MKKQTKQLLWLSVFLGILFLLWCKYLINNRGNADDSKIISIVVYDSDKERWESIREGALMAASNYGAEIRMVSITNELLWQEQIQLFERELRNGSDAFLIAAANSAQMKKFFEENDFPYPYEMIETGLSVQDTNSVEVNNYQMGADLAKQLVKEEDASAKIAVIVENEQRESVASRYQGFMDVMVSNKADVVKWERQKGEENIETKLLLQKMLTQEAVDLVVALDNSTFKAAIEAVDNLNKECGIYGVGNSDQAVSSLDNNICKALAYQDEFSMGYLGVCRLMDPKREEMTPEYRIVTANTLYTTENEKMLFPFVK